MAYAALEMKPPTTEQEDTYPDEGETHSEVHLQ